MTGDVILLTAPPIALPIFFVLSTNFSFSPNFLLDSAFFIPFINSFSSAILLAKSRASCFCISTRILLVSDRLSDTCNEDTSVFRVSAEIFGFKKLNLVFPNFGAAAVVAAAPRNTEEDTVFLPSFGIDGAL